MRHYDAVVIGAGHNGLTCACYLARAGMRVLVVEAKSTIGGMTSSEDLVRPGYRTDLHASGYQLASLGSAAAELHLDRFGLKLIRPTVALSKVLADQRCLSIRDTLDASCANIATFSTRDAETWRSLFTTYLASKDALRHDLEHPPASPGATLTALERGPDAQAQLRFREQSARSWTNETFESEAMRGLMADFAAHAGFAPDDAGGAAFAFLFLAVIQDFGNRVVEGGMGKLPAALAADLADHGGEIQTGTPVSQIVVEAGAATGVQLADGSVVRAGCIASSAHPHHLVLNLLEHATLEQGVRAAVERYEPGTSQMGIYLTLAQPPTYLAGADAAGATQTHLLPATVNGLAESFQAIRANQLPDEPALFIVNEAAVDPSSVPAGASSIKIILTTVPYAVDWQSQRMPYAQAVIDRLDRDFIPGLKQLITGMVVMSPVDYERDLLSAIRGTVTHGAMVLYQQGAMRPILQIGQYRGPVRGLYLCGAGSHPGPGVSMMPGRNAAGVILDDLQHSA